MQVSRFLSLSFSFVLFCSAAQAQMQQFGALEADLEALKEDVRALQRESYRSKNGNSLAPTSGADMALRMGEFDENLRDINGRLDEINHQIKTLDDRLNLINKDIDIRLKMLEGKPISGGAGGGIQAPKEKFKAPVAQNAPKSIVGDAIASGNDLPNVPTRSADEIYQAGLEALKANDFATAESSFDSVLRRFPKDKLAGNAQYWLGEVYYGRKNYKEAAIAFGKAYKQYKDGPKGPDSLLKLGMSMKELKKKTEACAAFTSMKAEFPKAEDRVKKKAEQEAKSLNCK